MGGVAVIRVSGPEAKEIVSKILPKGKDKKFIPGKFFHSYIINPNTGETIEEAIILYFKSPKSYTGEDVVEITVHGGLYSPQMVLDLLIRAGARLAEPGEFTKRAFLNGKMDLLQVQALLDLVRSRSALQVKYAISKLQGELSKKLKNVADALFNAIKEVEARVEFEEDVPPLDEIKFLSELARLTEELDKLLREGERNSLIFEGVKVAIAGKPNVGKSSLFNAILKRERAIVTEIPGTTRDFIHEEIFLSGIPVRIYDTAGLRVTPEPIESIGVERARDVIEDAHIVLFVVDGSREIEEGEIKEWNAIAKEKILVVNKVDLGLTITPQELKKLNPSNIVETSCLTGKGIDELERILEEMVKNFIVPSSEFSLSKRESHILSQAKSEIDEVLSNFNKMPLDIVSFHLQNAFNSLNQIFGWGDIPERILNSIFSEFCIGK
jgi:tRNA modification GTPase